MPLIRSLVCLLLLALTGSVHAQLSANYTVNVTGGCSPLAVTFTNTTTGASASATYTWVFGNGNALNNAPFSPTESAVYSTPQTYTATLTVTDGGNTSSKSITITVYPKPTVSFTYSNTTGCIPLAASFTSTSTPGAGTISNYFWDFGDGNTLSTTNPQVTNTYNFAQTYSPGLTVTNSFGCTSTLTQPNIVTVYPAVSASFTVDSTTLCNAADPVQFTNTSSGPGTLSYLWNFGDGTTSTVASPSHVFTSKGNYTITLVVTSSDGCSSTTVKTQMVNVADFNPSFTVPALACSNTPALFTDQTTPAPSASPVWTFGDGGSGTGTPATHAYTAPGTYNVTVTETFGKCIVSASKPVTVKAGLNPGGFAMQLDSVCGAPALVSFQDTSTGAVKWTWNFTGNPGDTSSARAPTFTYTANGTYTPTLTITAANGCSGSISKPLAITAPSAVISAVQSTAPSSSVCAIINAAFTATSPDTLVQYLWNFGDGTTGTGANPTHSYSVPGTYTISLSFVTNHGCRGVSNTIPIIVYPKPHAAFSATDTLICGNTPVAFQNQSTGNASTYIWNYGNGVSQVNNGNPAYYAYGDSGTYTVTLVATNPGCSDTAIRTNYITVLNPFPNIKPINTCDSTRGTVTFTDSATYAKTWTWNFGDGTAPYAPSTAQDTVYHTYAHSGTYTVILTCTNGACTVADTAKVYVLLKQQPQLSATLSTICAGTALPYKLNGLDTNYQSVASGGGNYYSINNWQYGDSSAFSGSGAGLKTSYSGNVNGLTSGKDSLRVILKSAYFGCYDTSNYIPMKINGPIPAFSVQGGNLCYKFPVAFTDSSRDSVRIVKWQWTFGDSATATRSTGDTVMHVYVGPGTYQPTLTVTDSLGCSATTSASYTTVSVIGPKANFYWTPSNITPGTTATFFNSSTGAGGATYQWYFKSDGSTSTNANSVNHTYPVPTMDTVRLIATGSGGGTCVDTAIKAVPVEALNASFTYTTKYINSANCPPMLASFVSNTFAADSLHWDFGDGATADNNPTPSHTYMQPGVYLVTLTAFGAGGLNVVSKDSVVVKGPYASLRANILVGCIPQQVTLTASARYASAYTWDFGDGTVVSSSDTVQSHTYMSAGIYMPALILTDSTGCQGTFNPQSPLTMDTLHVQPMPALRYCDSGLVQFSDSVLSFAQDSLHENLTWHWNFATGNAADTANLAQPFFSYNKPGTYAVQAQVSAPTGCSVMATDTVKIVQSARAPIVGPASVCAGDSVQYTASPSAPGNISWYWNLGPSDTSTLASPPKEAFPAGQDSIRLILSLNGCNDTIYALLTVNPYPTLGLSPLKATICQGDSVHLGVNPGPSYTWSPAQGLSNDTSAGPNAGPAATTMYHVTGDLAGCIRSDSALVTVIPFIVLHNPADTFVCKGNSVNLTVTGANLYQWSPAGTLNQATGSSVQAAPDTTTVYTVIGQDSYHCFADTTLITVNVMPMPMVTLPAGVSAPAGVGVTLQPAASANVVSYTWTPADGLSCTACADPQAFPASSTTYTVAVATADGCTAVASETITLICREDAVTMPSAFTPNGDGHNDKYYPMGKGIKTIAHFQIWDRWGRPVFERENISINSEAAGWDGTYQGRQMPPGAYVYMLEVVCETGEVFHLKGTVVLIR